jgi:hypothetical protein
MNAECDRICGSPIVEYEKDSEDFFFHSSGKPRLHISFSNSSSDELDRSSMFQSSDGGAECELGRFEGRHEELNALESKIDSVGQSSKSRTIDNQNEQTSDSDDSATWSGDGSDGQGKDADFGNLEQGFELKKSMEDSSADFRVIQKQNTTESWDRSYSSSESDSDFHSAPRSRRKSTEKASE